MVKITMIVLAAQATHKGADTDVWTDCPGTAIFPPARVAVQCRQELSWNQHEKLCDT